MLNDLLSISNFSWATGLAQISATIITFMILLRFGVPGLNRQQTRIAGLIWIFAVTAEYWIGGPFSFAFKGIDIDMSLPFYLFLNETHDSGLYSHSFNGGTDVGANMAFSGQYISFERFLLGNLPIWVANMVQKLLSVGIGVWGTYLVARRFGRVERELALGLAFLYPLSHHFMIHHSWFHGLGYSIIPIAAYLCVCRYGKRHYIMGAVLVSGVFAISSSQPLGGMAFFASLILAAVLTEKQVLSKIVVVIGIPGTFVLANWHESLYAKALIGPLTFRGSDHTFAENRMVDVVSRLTADLSLSIEVSIIMLIAFVLLGIRQPKRLLFPLITCALALWSGTIINQFPWQSFGIPQFAGVNFGYIAYSITFIGLLVVSIICGSFPVIPYRKLVVIAAFSIALGKFAWYKTVNIPEWLSSGGLPVLTENIKRFQNPAWVPEAPFRVVSIPYRLSPNMASVVGLDALDGVSNLILRSTAYFWTRGVLNVRPNLVNGGFMMIKPPNLDFKCCNFYNVLNYMDLDFLRIANVGYIISTLPLQGGGLVQVAGQVDGSVPPRNNIPIVQRLGAYAETLVKPSIPYVYAVGSHLPRVYEARDIVISPKSASVDQYLALIGKHAMSRKAVVREDTDTSSFTFSKSLRIKEFRLVRDGFDITVSSPNGGSILINAPFMPFWKAEANGSPTHIVPANMIQMLVKAPAGSKEIKLSYKRPRIKDKFSAYLNTD